ncbi:hypothetical protein [Paracidovorax anthurii]|uniref:Uncharacterized protein n=1 Tax=Paracidovorax anthurii TaxID=78229 RepID=A0A328ZK36_9BURK|nr:hypothetical protein [Paracidovorax anthurii]RAR85002.1 hypothetical protein AX018_100895 [Paracidovorax anthurii]
MTAIISRSPESATQATPAARKSKAEKPAVGVPPTTQAPISPAAGAADWQRPVRTALTQIAGLLDQLEEPAPGWGATDTPTELISHAARRVNNILRQEDGEDAWASSITMWDAILWPFESLRAAVELGALRGWAASTSEAFGLLTAANDQLTALQKYVAAQPAAIPKPFQEKPRPPIRREPEAARHSVNDTQRVFSELANQASTLRDFLLGARHDVERTGNHLKACNDFLMAEYLCAFIGSVCDQMVNYDVAGGPAEWAIDSSLQTDGGAA